jgi:hypothetical protein
MIGNIHNLLIENDFRLSELGRSGFYDIYVRKNQQIKVYHTRKDLIFFNLRKNETSLKSVFGLGNYDNTNIITTLTEILKHNEDGRYNNNSSNS